MACGIYSCKNLSVMSILGLVYTSYLVWLIFFSYSSLKIVCLVVVMYHSESGGCCDCGDKDAWKEEGYVPFPWLNTKHIEHFVSLKNLSDDCDNSCQTLCSYTLNTKIFLDVIQQRYWVWFLSMNWSNKFYSKWIGLVIIEVDITINLSLNWKWCW